MNLRYALLPALLLTLWASVFTPTSATAQPLHESLVEPPTLEGVTLGAAPAWATEDNTARLLPELHLEGLGGLGDATPSWAGALGGRALLGWRPNPHLLTATQSELELAAIEGSPLSAIASPEHGLRGRHRIELIFTPQRAPSPSVGQPLIAALLRLELDHAGERRPWLRPIHLGPAPYVDGTAHLELHLGREWGALIESSVDVYSHSLGDGWLAPTTILGASIAPGVWGDSLSGRSFGNSVQVLRAGILQADRRASPIQEEPVGWTSRLLDLRLFDLEMRERSEAASAHGLIGGFSYRVESDLGAVIGLDGEGWGLIGRMTGVMQNGEFTLGAGVSRTAELSSDGSQWLLIRRIEATLGTGYPSEANGRLVILGDQLEGMDKNLPDNPLRFGVQGEANLPIGAGWQVGFSVRTAYDTTQVRWTPAPDAGWNLQGGVQLRWIPALNVLSTRTGTDE